MIRNEVTIDEAIELLNEALDTDQAAVSVLVNTRVRCSAYLAEHPTIQVGERPGVITAGEPPLVYQFGLLGVLNGLFGFDEKGRGPITAIVVDGAVVVKFQRTDEGED